MRGDSRIRLRVGARGCGCVGGRRVGEVAFGSETAGALRLSVDGVKMVREDTDLCKVFARLFRRFYELCRLVGRTNAVTVAKPIVHCGRPIVSAKRRVRYTQRAISPPRLCSCRRNLNEYRSRSWDWFRDETSIRHCSLRSANHTNRNLRPPKHRRELRDI